MRKTFLLGLVSMAALVFGAGNAAAFPITGSPGGTIAATGASFTVEGPLGVDVICDVTLNGSLNTSVARANATAGTITGVSLSGCNYSTSVLSASFPWTIRTVSHTTPLSQILNTINGVGFQVSGLPLAGTCLFSGSINFAIAVDGSGNSGGITTLASTLSSTCPLVTGRVVANQAFTLSPTQNFTI
jgi:hypothetical protein